MTGILSNTVFKYISIKVLYRVGINPVRLRSFLDEIESRYNDNPYHNRDHAESVIHASQCLFTVCELEERILDADLCHVALLVAAAAHDVGHPGSLDRNFTEERHVQIAKEVMLDPRCDFLVDCLDRDTFMQLFTYLIMNTAMDVHGKCLSNLNTYKHTFTTHNTLSQDASRSVLSIILKCADLWHVILPWAEHERWTNKFLQECREDNDKNFVTEQIFFIQFICLPCFQCLTEFCPNTKILINDLDKNLCAWKVIEVNA